MLTGGSPGTLESLRAAGDKVEQLIRQFLEERKGELSQTLAPMQGAVRDQGLRVRPFLLLASYGAGDTVPDCALRVAAAFELLQSSTLVIDDVLDESDLRNGLPSIAGHWGRGPAVAVGTIMSSLAFEMFCEGLKSCKRCIDPTAAMGLFAKTQRQIYVGQFIDLLQESKKETTEVEYYDMIYLTTACFIEASLVMGALLWNAPEMLTALLRNIGRNLGIAYQIRDDVIDLLGDSEMTGKPVAGDVRQRKMRLPVIRALRAATNADSATIRELYCGDRAMKDDDVTNIVDILRRSGAIEYSIEQAKNHCRQAAEDAGHLRETSKDLADNLVALAALISEFDQD